ncbi:MAG: hypothetical protein KGR16_02400 [Verrucomicrobia bacterium]|nr:hypothetical protein [Verrucomicrobiota bacterium]MDE3047466.1 hypothetical protein [Verrucomicrobiota bacterium]
MKNSFLNFLKENTSDATMDVEQIRKILYESRQYFRALRVQLASEDQKKRKEALVSIQEVQRFLETQADRWTTSTEFEPTKAQQAIIDEIQESFNNES